MKYLNDQAIADNIMLDRESVKIDPAFQKAVEEALAAKAEAKSQSK
jgi:hypothetical protein